MSTTVLVTHGDHAVGGLHRHLRHDGFEVVNGTAPVELRPDVVLAGDDAGLERWRGEAPVIVLGEPEADPLDRVRAFRRGCDDYVARPFHYEELVERIHAVLRRARPALAERLVAGPLEIDLVTRVVTVAGASVPLSQKEFALVVRLAAEPRRVFTRAELLQDIWGCAAHVRTRTLDAHTSRLRRKLREADPATFYVENVWGVGYRLLGLHP